MVETFEDLRDSVSAPSEFPGKYMRAPDAEREYPKAFVRGSPR